MQAGERQASSPEPESEPASGGLTAVVRDTSLCGPAAQTPGGCDSLPNGEGVKEESVKAEFSKADGKEEEHTNRATKGADKETWWECDYCSRAFASLDVASAHELKCSRNPEVRQQCEARDAQVRVGVCFTVCS